MPANRHTRHDFTLRGRFVRTDKAELQLGDAMLLVERSLLSDQTGLTERLRAWQPFVDVASSTYSGIDMRRLAIRMQEPALVEVAWEEILSAIAERPVLAVRISDVQPRATQRLFDFPARVLALGKGGSVIDAVDKLLDSRSDYAMVVKSTSAKIAEKEIDIAQWPVVDIVHFEGEADLLLTRTGADDPGSMRWLLRRCDRWNVRVIVIEAKPHELPALRRVAQTIVDRGGPAIILFDRKKIDVAGFYADLLHDRPLDWITYELGGTLFGGAGREEAIRFSAVARYLLDPGIQQMLHAKADHGAAAASPVRAMAEPEKMPATLIRDTLEKSAKTVNLKLDGKAIAAGQEWTKYSRFNDVVQGNLVDRGYLVKSLGGPFDAMRDGSVSLDDLATEVHSQAMPIEHVLDPETAPRLESFVADKIEDFQKSERDYVFDFHEGGGTLPLAAKSTALRKIVQAGATRALPKGLEPQTPPLPRHVNTRFYTANDDGELLEVAQENARLTPCATVHLGIRIGEKDKLLQNVGDLIFADEGIEWTPQMTGTWIEVALTPIDFENAGEPVQEFWLPRNGESPLITFAVRPNSFTTISGVARMRFTFYHRNNVLQSFRVAALLDSCGHDTTKKMSAALDADLSLIGASDAGYLTRLEYSAVDPANAASAPPRSLSIVANESAGEKIFSIKGTDFFSTTIDANVGDHVKSLRAALLSSSKTPIDEYLYDADNSGTEDKLLERLWPIAQEGWGLYFSILKDGAQQAKAAELLGSGGTIHAAHIKLQQLITWPLIYDRLVDPNRTTWYDKATDSDIPVDRALCLAGKPDADGNMADGECVTDANCILSAKGVADYRANHGGNTICLETVICPRRFWGFMHQIEVPAQQTGGQKIGPLPEVVTAAKPVGIIAGFNPNVKQSDTHEPALDAAVKKLKTATILAANKKRNRIVQSFDDNDPDVVYLYCHAYPDSKEKANDPNLDFGNREAGDFVRPAELAGKAWSHAPLVFLNACGSVGFSAEAPAEFITAFVQNRLASAVVGTEVTVWPELATAMALEFLQDFLAGKFAGEALLRARRKLLAKFNPLGLVYTLYGSINLHIQ